MNARQTRINAARVMGATRLQLLKDVMFFESLTPTFVGLRMGVSIALVVIIVAEMFIGSTDGMGHRIIDAQQIYDLADMIALPGHLQSVRPAGRRHPRGPGWTSSGPP